MLFTQIIKTSKQIVIL